MWTDDQRLRLHQQFVRIGWIEGETWPTPADINPEGFLRFLETVPESSGLAGYLQALKVANR